MRKSFQLQRSIPHRPRWCYSKDCSTLSHTEWVEVNETLCSWLESRRRKHQKSIGWFRSYQGGRYHSQRCNLQHESSKNRSSIPQSLMLECHARQIARCASELQKSRRGHWWLNLSSLRRSGIWWGASKWQRTGRNVVRGAYRRIYFDSERKRSKCAHTLNLCNELFKSLYT